MAAFCSKLKEVTAIHSKSLSTIFMGTVSFRGNIDALVRECLEKDDDTVTDQVGAGKQPDSMPGYLFLLYIYL